MNHFFFQKSNYVKSERHSKLSCFNIITLFTSTNNKLIQYIFNPKRKKLSQSNNRYIFCFFGTAAEWWITTIVGCGFCLGLTRPTHHLLLLSMWFLRITANLIIPTEVGNQWRTLLSCLDHSATSKFRLDEQLRLS